MSRFGPLFRASEFLLFFLAAYAGGQDQQQQVPSVTVSLAKGSRFEAQWIGLSDGRLFRFLVEGKEQAVPGDTIIDLEWRRETAENLAPKIRLQFVNEDILVGDPEKGPEGFFLLRSISLGSVSVNLKHLRFLECLDKTVQETVREKFRKTLSAKDSREDKVVLVNGDVLPGVLENITDSALSVRSELGPLEIGLDRVYGVVFTALASEFAPPKELVAVLECAGGEVATARLLSLEGERLSAQTIFGQKLAISMHSLQKISFRNGALVYLSDLNPESVREIPFFEVSYPYRRDRSQGDNPLRLRGKAYPKGLGVHSKTILTFPLDGQYSRFQSDIGIDDEVEKKGSVVFQVLADDQTVYSSPEVRGGEPAIRLDLNVQGVKRLSLVVDFGKDFHICDHADWGDARLLR